MKIAILNYADSSVMITSIPEFQSDDEIEAWIADNLGFRGQDISWMTAEHLDININI